MPMNSEFRLLAPASGPAVIREEVDDGLILVTTAGLVKDVNEDRLGFLRQADQLLVAIADGHWGDAAAQLAVEHMLAIDPTLPLTDEDLGQALFSLQDKLGKLYVSDDIDEEITKTPETSLLLAIIDRTNSQLTIAGYGDCRAIVLRADQVIYNYAIKPTWLGAFSKVGMRARLSAADGMVIDKISLEKDDRIILYTDGVDESVYETPSIDVSRFSRNNYGDIRSTAQALVDKIFSTGAEDNASFAFIEI